MKMPAHVRISTQSRVISRILICAFWLTLATQPSCALLGLLTSDPQGMTEDRFYALTGHNLLKIYEKEARLGYLFDGEGYVKKAWGGQEKISEVGQNIEIWYTRENFDKIKLFLGSDFEIGPELSHVDAIRVSLENLKKYELIDFQPLIEFLGPENEDVSKDFIISMIKVSKFSISTFTKTSAEIGAAYIPYPGIMLKGSTGIAASAKEEQLGYDIFIGYRLYNGERWIEDFERLPKVEVTITKPTQGQVVKFQAVRVYGHLFAYPQLDDLYKNRLQIYLMAQDEFQNHWILQRKAGIVDKEGHFEGPVQLGDLDQGNGHKYRIVAFVSYFEIDCKVNATIRFLPFNKGKDIVTIKREDDF